MERMQMQSRNNWVGFAGGVGLAGITAGAALLGGRVGMAVFAFALLTGFSAVAFLSRSEWATIGRADADERQRSIDNESVRVAYMAVLLVAIPGFLVELARGNPGPFTAICAVGGFSHMAAVTYFKRRR
ncbi:MAG: hypothetical protein QOF21_2176 [Actinomycetota bacterium]|jgi:hypothetical protein